MTSTASLKNKQQQIQTNNQTNHRVYACCFCTKGKVKTSPFRYVTIWGIHYHLSKGSCRGFSNIKIKNMSNFTEGLIPSLCKHPFLTSIGCCFNTSTYVRDRLSLSVRYGKDGNITPSSDVR